MTALALNNWRVSTSLCLHTRLTFLDAGRQGQLPCFLIKVWFLVCVLAIISCLCRCSDECIPQGSAAKFVWQQRTSWLASTVR
jgi:hypothetical protein